VVARLLRLKDAPKPADAATAWPWRSPTSSVVIAQVSGRLAAKQADRVMIETPGASATKSSSRWGNGAASRGGRGGEPRDELVVREDGCGCTAFTMRPGGASSSG